MKQNKFPFNIKGMNQDSLATTGEFSFENKNIRFFKDANSLYTITNEKGLSKVSRQIQTIHKDVLGYNTSNIEINGIIVGYKLLKDTLILIVRLSKEGVDADENISNYPYAIYSYANTSNQSNHQADWELQSTLYTDKISNLSYDTYIEINGNVENNSLYKFYISTNDYNCPTYYFYVKDGIINGIYDENHTLQVDGNREMHSEYEISALEHLSKVVFSTVQKISNSGNLPTGTVQYFLVHFVENGSISQVVWQSSILYVGTSKVDPNTTVTCSFLIKFLGANVDTDYKCFALQRTSYGALNLYDISTSKTVTSNYFTFTDSNNFRVSTTVDFLQQLLKYNTRYVTATVKDATYIAGNITINNVQISRNLLESAANLSEANLEIDYKDIYLTYENNGNSNYYNPVGSVYDNTSQLDCSVNIGTTEVQYHTNKYFHSREVYRFGIQLQNKYGQYTNVLYIGDKYITGAPYVVTKNNSTYFYIKVPIVKMSTAGDLKDENGNTTPQGYLKSFLAEAKNEGFIGVRPVVVFPDINQRLTVFQGAVNPTIFNMQDRIDGIKYAQASYLWRPIITQDLMYNYALYTGDSESLINHSKSYLGRYFQTRNKAYDSVPSSIRPTESISSLGNVYPPEHEIDIDKSWQTSVDVDSDSSNDVFNYYFGCRPAIYKASDLNDDNEDSAVLSDIGNSSLVGGDIGYQFAEYRHYHVIPDAFKFNGEIDYSPSIKLLGLSRAVIHPYIQTGFKSLHCIDTSIVTLHSPDLYYTDYYDNLDYSNVRFRLIGTIPITGYTTDRELQATDLGWSNATFRTPYKHHYHKDNYGPTACGYSLNVPAWKDHIYKNNTGDSEYSQDDYVYPIPVFKSSSLANSSNKSLLKYQLQSHFHYSPFSIYHYNTFEISGNNSILLNGNIDNEHLDKNTYKNYIGDKKEDIKIFNSDSTTNVFLNIDGKNCPYSGNIDTIITDTLASGIPIWKTVNNNTVGSVNIGVSNLRFSRYANLYFSDEDIVKTKKSGVSVKYKTTKHAVIAFPTGITNEVKTSLGLPYPDLDNFKYNTKNDVADFLNDYTPELNKLLENSKENYHFAWDTSIKHVGVNNNNSSLDNGTAGYPIYGTRFTINNTNPLYNITNNYHYNKTSGTVGISQIAFGGFLYLGELYRDTPENISDVFGGTSKEVLQTHIWHHAGMVYPLYLVGDDQLANTIIWSEGDTYYTRFNNIKTYPFTEEDQNQIVDTLSFMCESRINTDATYNNITDKYLYKYLRPHKNFLLNEAYSQTDDYIPGVYTAQSNIVDSIRDDIRFPHSIIWSIPKLNGELTDSWLNLSPVNILDLDGKYGEIKRLVTFKNNIYAFQESGIAVIFYNEREVVSTNAGNSLTIANSNKIEKYEYVSIQYGLQHSSALVISENYIYFIDHKNLKFLQFDGVKVEDIGTTCGFDSWFKSNLDYSTIDNYGTSYMHGGCEGDSLYYNKVMNEIYFINKDICLCYSIQFGTFTSFYSYEKFSGMFNSNTKTYFINTLKTGTYNSLLSNILEQHGGEYNVFAPKIELLYDIKEGPTEKTITIKDDIFAIKSDYSMFETVEEFSDNGERIIKYYRIDYVYSDRHLSAVLNQVSYKETSTKILYKKETYTPEAYYIEFLCAPEFKTSDTPMYMFESIDYINEVYDNNTYMPNNTFTHIGMQIPYVNKMFDLTEIHYSTYGSAFSRKLDSKENTGYNNHTFRSNAQKKLGVWNVKLPRPNLRVDSLMESEIKNTDDLKNRYNDRMSNRFTTNYAVYPWIKIKLYNDGKDMYKSVLHNLKVVYYNL